MRSASVAPRPAWTKTTLGNLATFINGMAFKPTDWGTTGRPIIRIQNLTGSSNVVNRYEGEVAEKYVVRDGDLLMSWSATLGVFVWRGEDAVLNQHIFRVIPKDCDAAFLQHLLVSMLAELRETTHGSSMTHLTKGRFEATEVFVPPLEEQRRIAKLLDGADEIQRLRKEANEKARRILPALFNEMFGDPATNPMGWELKPLSELARIDARLVDPRDSKYADMLLIGGENIEEATGRIINPRCAREVAAISNKYLFNDNHILYSKIRPYLNKVALPKIDGLCSADIYPISPIEGASTHWFLLGLLRSNAFLRYAATCSSRLRIPKLNRGELWGFQAIAPPIEQQIRFEELATSLLGVLDRTYSATDSSDEAFSVLRSRLFAS